MTILKTIFKKTSTGKTQIWYQEIDGNRYRTVSGQKDGAKVTSEWTTCGGKNIGKANETSPAAQAQSEVDSNYTKKLAQGGYHEQENDIGVDKFIKPMLAKNYDDYPVTIRDIQRGIVFSQPKLDGVRCILTSSGLWTRQGKPIISAPHIFRELDPKDDTILDGELYSNLLNDNFNKIISLVKQSNPTQRDLDLCEEFIKFWAYDVPSVDAKFSERYKYIQNHKESNALVKVQTDLVGSLEHLDALQSEYLADGLEGQIVRIDGNHYENKRTKQLLKRKKFMDKEFTVIDIEEGEGNRSGMAGGVWYVLDEFKGISTKPNEPGTFSSNIQGGNEYYKQLLIEKNEYIDGVGTVKFFGYTPAGIPRFPVTIALYKGQRDI